MPVPWTLPKGKEGAANRTKRILNGSKKKNREHDAQTISNTKTTNGLY